ncbi:hypothetical protein BDP27DRAFT_1327543, partial [Rhodocollybia butyracea]
MYLFKVLLSFCYLLLYLFSFACNRYQAMYDFFVNGHRSRHGQHGVRYKPVWYCYSTMVAERLQKGNTETITE